MDLIAESLDVILHAQCLTKFLDRIRVFVTGCKHAEGYFDAFGIGGIDHGGVDFSDGGEGGAGLGGQGDNLYHEISNAGSIFLG